MRLVVLSALFVVAAALRFARHEDVEQDLISDAGSVPITKPKRTILADIVGTWDLDGDLARDLDGGKATPVKLSKAPVTMMTGVDRLSLGIQKAKGFEDYWSQHLLEEWRNSGEKGSFVDVGANMGAFTLPLSHALTSGKHDDDILIAVEALPLNRRLLRYSLKENKMDNVHLYEYAVLGPEAAARVNFGGGGPNSGHAGVAKNGDIVVPVTTLDAIWKQEGKAMENVFAMKIDIEGSESHALRGGTQWLEEHGPCMIMIELNHGAGNIPAVNELKAHGYARKFFGDIHSRNKIFTKENYQECVSNLK